MKAAREPLSYIGVNTIGLRRRGFNDQQIINIEDDDLISLKVISRLEHGVCVSFEKSKVNIEELINLIKKNNTTINDISTDDGDLEDVFIHLIKN